MICKKCGVGKLILILRPRYDDYFANCYIIIRCDACKAEYDILEITKNETKRTEPS